MTARQRAFCEHYAACGNATEAARRAGYSPRTARSQGQRLLTDVDIAAHIRQLQDKAAAGRIVSITQVRALWSDILNDPNERTADRLKASELLARASGLFLHIRPGPDDDMRRLAVGEYDGGDVVIYLPQIQRVEDCQMEEEAETGG